MSEHVNETGTGADVSEVEEIVEADPPETGVNTVDEQDDVEVSDDQHPLSDPQGDTAE